MTFLHSASSRPNSALDSADIGDLDGNSFTWTPKLKAGQKIQLSLEDESGDESWTGAVRLLSPG